MNKEILEITKKFHDTYEKLASEYTYETREDTKVFDINSNNGKLMYATVNEIVSPILKENEQLKADYGTQAQIERDMLQQENKILKENAENNDKVVDKVNWENMLLKKENQELKDNWSKLKEWVEEGMKNSLHIPYECELDFEDVLDKMQEIEGGINGKI